MEVISIFPFIDIITPILKVNKMRIEAVVRGPTRRRAGNHAVPGFQAKRCIRCSIGCETQVSGGLVAIPIGWLSVF